jgi:hypothetical protein
MTTAAPLALAGDADLIAELARRGTIVYLVGRVDDLALEYPKLARDDILAGLQRVKEPIGNSSIPDALGDITFTVFAYIVEAAA